MLQREDGSVIRDLDRRFIDSFRLAAVQAGAVARHLQGKIKPESKPGPSAEAEALTAVDLATQDVILHLLHRDLPDVVMDAEEETETLALFPGVEDPASDRPLVVVDPVDGTLNYSRGSSDYAVMGGLLQGGRFRAALIHFPVADAVYWAIRGAGCFTDGPAGPRRLRASGGERRIFVDPRTPGAWRVALAARFGAAELCRCSAVDASAPATGRARGAVSAGGTDRRRAIGLFLSLEAGAAVRLGGQRWDGEDPALLADSGGLGLVAEDDALADELIATIDAAGGLNATTAGW
jgi:fructose-1,6-bisphosphatase/inositol monophosphatase family enzyme